MSMDFGWSISTGAGLVQPLSFYNSQSISFEKPGQLEHWSKTIESFIGR
jgi:hypothetical protein